MCWVIPHASYVGFATNIRIYLMCRFHHLLEDLSNSEIYNGLLEVAVQAKSTGMLLIKATVDNKKCQIREKNSPISVLKKCFKINPISWYHRLEHVRTKLQPQDEKLQNNFDRTSDMFNDVQQILESEIRTQTRWKSVAKSLGMHNKVQEFASGRILPFVIKDKQISVLMI